MYIDKIRRYLNPNTESTVFNMERKCSSISRVSMALSLSKNHEGHKGHKEIRAEFPSFTFVIFVSFVV